MPATATTAPLDRWDLIADRLWQLPELGWAIAEANPDLADLLVLPAGIAVAVPELESLRRPLTAANPAREEGAGFIEVPGGPSPLPSPSPSPGAITFPIKIEQGGTEATTSQQALANLGAIAIASKGVPGGVAPLDGGALIPSINLPPYPTLSSLGGVASTSIGVANGIAPLDSNARVPAANLPAFQSPLTLPLAIAQGGTGAATASAGLTALGGIATSQRGVANGVAPLDASSLVPSANLPPYPTLASLGALAASSRGAANGVAPLGADSLVPAVNLPAFQSPLSFPLTIAQGGTNATSASAALTNLGAMAANSRNTANGVAPLDANSLIPISNIPLNSPFPFTNGASFRGGANPAITPTLVQVSVDSSGLPRYWLVNANAPANSRIKSITVANNGNVQIRHHNDDLSDGNVLEHTASGNVLTNGTLRPGSGAAVFTGASFVPGAIYFRTDISSAGTGTLTYSDGTNWMRVSNGSLASSPDPGIVDLVNNQNIAGNKNFTGFTNLGDNVAIKKKLLSGITSASQGGSASVAHGINSAKIINATGVIYYAAGLTVPILSRQTNYAAYFAIDATNLNLVNETANSAGILSKSFYVVLEYIA